MTSAMKLLLTGSMLMAAIAGTAADLSANQKKATQLEKDGNVAEAYDLYRKLLLDRRADPAQAPKNLAAAVRCLQRLNRRTNIDDLLEKTVAVQADNWRLLQEAADISLHRISHYGFLIGGEFQRGPHRGGRGGRNVNTFERDRRRALQWMNRALPLVQADAKGPEAADFYLAFAAMFLDARRGAGDSWRLQVLTDLSSLPEYGEPTGGGRTQGAPVDAEGHAVFYPVPTDFAAAVNDGQRWHWLLRQAERADPDHANRVRLMFAGFLQQQFGVQTMAAFYGRYFSGNAQDERAGILAVHTLKDTETLCRLATGIQRFTLPEEFNFITIYRSIADGDSPVGKREAILALAQLYENRRQYPKAVTWWERYMTYDQAMARKRIKRITGNWGQFEPLQTQPAGTAATVSFRFRNAKKIECTAYRIDLKKLVDDVCRYIRGKPQRLDWTRTNLGDIGRRLVYDNQTKYLLGKAAEWGVKLEPRPNHFDRRITLTTPLKEAGAYLLVGSLPGGNVSRIIVMLDDTAIVRKQLDKQHLIYVTDAVSGKPLPNAEVTLFGYHQEWVRKTRKHRITTKEVTRTTDADGMLLLNPNDIPQNYTWLITATLGKRFAYDGFTGLGFPNWYDREYKQEKIFALTDRPVYRPGHTVHWKAWIRHAQYDMGDESHFAGAEVSVDLRDPRNKSIFSDKMKADAFGGISGMLMLKDDAILGVYTLRIQAHRGNRRGSTYFRQACTFRVEEYKKPEFEVTIEAPSEPVMLGETIPAKIKATYYFGAPVTKATVKIKVLRRNHAAQWYPWMPWDWFYGPGYWWFAYDYPWYPGWEWWGCPRPAYWWSHGGGPPPEVVMDATLPIGPDGTVTVNIDTAIAKELHGDADHRYDITAEVRDESRRTIVGSGHVLVARKPFKVYVWPDRGHYRVGDTIRASLQARTLDGKGVRGKGRLRLLAVSYDAKRAPVEKEVRAWDLDTDDSGRAFQKLTADRAGQYRLSYTLTDGKGHKIEGGYVFTIRGKGTDGRNFRFSQIELIPDKTEYQPGERMELAVNTDHENGVVLLFVRPANGVAKPPKVLRLQGRSTIVNIDITKKDMPNFYLEALIVFDGKTYDTVKEIVVPPEKRILHVELLPSATRFKPGEKGRLRLKLTDANGEPYVGSVVVSVYDKSVEYISGGTNIGDIREFFWKWRRRHNESFWSTLGRWFNNLLKKNEKPMRDIGIFGHVATEVNGYSEGAAMGGGMRGGPKMLGARRALGMRRKGVNMMDGEMAMAAPAPMVAMEAMSDKAAAPGKAPGMAAAGAGTGEPQVPVQPAIRKEFADTALWVASLATAADGTAEVEVPFPDNLTTWKIRVWAMGQGTRVGEGSIEVITSKNLLLRLQAPRFFVQNDEVVLSANVHNYLDTGKDVRVLLELDGPCLDIRGPAAQSVHIDASGETRVDWRVRALREGEAIVRMKALTDEESDAVEMRFPVYVHGMDKMVSLCGLVRPQDKRAEAVIEVPDQRRPEATRLELRFSPSLAMAMIDALPYLVDYPYGCTEQTLNRFLPTVITQNVLQKMGVSLAEIRDKRTNLNAQELGDAKERAAQWKRYLSNPVFDEDKVADMVREGIEALVAMQLGDGGWGWFSGWGEHAYPHTTATVVHGLQIAVQNDVQVDKAVLQRGIEWLKRYQDEQVRRLTNALKTPKVEPWKTHADNTDALVYRVLADADIMNPKMRDYLFRDRTQSLSLYGMALYGLGLQRQRQTTKLSMILRNLGQYIVRDEEDQTAYLNMNDGWAWWSWYGSEIETHAAYLKLLCAAEPKNDLLPRLVKYLLNNRKHATYWRSTRDTALCVEAFADYIAAVGEDRPNMVVTMSFDGRPCKKVTITPANLFTFDNAFVLEGERVKGGKHTVELLKEGTGPLYWNCYLSTFTLEDFIPKAGLEVKVERRIYRLRRDDKQVNVAGARGQALTQRAEHYKREPIDEKTVLKSGDLIEIELLVESKNDYEYIVIEDMKAAGFEPVDVRSGYTGNELGAYVQFRDERTAFFVRRLARGKHSVSYRLRAEIPGRFSALPATIRAMYAPELRGNSDENKVEIRD